MRRDRKADPRKTKDIARKKYAERQIEKFVKWSWEIKDKVKYKDILKLHEQYKVECYAERRERKRKW